MYAYGPISTAERSQVYNNHYELHTKFWCKQKDFF